LSKIDALYECAETSIRPPSFNFDLALSSLSKVIFLAPQDRKAYTMRGEIYLSLGDLSSSLSNFKRSLLLDPNDALLQKRMAAVIDVQANQYLANGEYAVASSLFTKAIELDGLCWQYYMHRSLCKIHLQKYLLAIRDIDHVLILHKFNPDTYVLRAKLRWYLGKIASGNVDFRRAHALDPNHPEVLIFEQLLWKNADQAYREASSAIMMKNFTLALRKLKAAVELNPEDVKMLILKASVHRSMKQYGQALGDLDVASRVFHRQRESVLEQREEREEEEEEDQGREGRRRGGGGGGGGGMNGSMSPTSRGNASNRSGGYDVEGGGNGGGPPKSSNKRPVEFSEHAEITRQRNLTLNDMAVDRFRHQNYRGAITLFNQVIESEKNADVSAAAAREGQSFVNVSFFSNRGDCHRELGMLQQALADYHVAYDLDPTNWETTTRLGMIHDQFGLQLYNASRYPEACVEFQTAIEYNGRIVQFRMHCAKCCKKINQLEEAYKQYVEVIKIDPNNVDAVRELSNMGGAPTIVAVAAAGGGSTSLPRLNGSKGRGTGGRHSSSNSLHHSSSSGYLIPPRVPKILTEGRRKEKIKKNRASNLFNGSCSLKDPLLVLLKGARNNPYVKK
jgi:tetratricopeptide (TPR) repeat protein